MFNESELLTQFHTICLHAEVLALKSLHDIELPLCGYLTELTSSDCLNLINELHDGINLNQPSVERILLNYIITDYVSCGLSSPIFYTVFHTTLQSNKSKIKLLEKLTTFWECLFKNYKITSVDIDFIKHFVISLERLFLKISNYHSCIKFQCNKVISRLKYDIKLFDQRILDGQILHTLNENNIEEQNSYKKKFFEVQNDLKVNPLIPSLCLQTNQNTQIMKSFGNKNKVNMDLHKSYQTNNSNSEENVSIKRTEPNLDSTMIQPGQKRNAFQVMMLNAKKRKTKAK